MHALDIPYLNSLDSLRFFSLPDPRLSTYQYLHLVFVHGRASVAQDQQCLFSSLRRWRHSASDYMTFL